MVLFQSSRITGPDKIMETMLQLEPSYFTGPSEVAGREGRRMGGERVSNRDIHASKKNPNAGRRGLGQDKTILGYRQYRYLGS